MDGDGLIRNPGPSQVNSTRAQWHLDKVEKEVFGWHAFAFLSCLATTRDSMVWLALVIVEEDLHAEYG